MADGFLQVPPDSTGKKVETTEITRPDGSLIQRQRFELGDGENLSTTNSLLSELIREIREFKLALLGALH